MDPTDFFEAFSEREIHSFPMKSFNNKMMHIVALSDADKRAWHNGIKIHSQFISEQVSKVNHETPYVGWDIFFEAGADVLLRKSMAYPDGRLMWENDNKGYEKFLNKVTAKSGIVNELVREILVFNNFASDDDLKKNNQ